jgi:molybdopterin/thiamine biosynthesis adenylyltransferase
MDTLNNFRSRFYLVAGCGALGSRIAVDLARLGAEHLSLLDCDRVEEKNTRNQLYTFRDVGATKVAALSNYISLATGKRCVWSHRKLTPDNARSEVSNSDLVIDCFDNAFSRNALSAACRKLSIPCMHVGIASEVGEVVWTGEYAPVEGLEACTLDVSLTVITVTAAIAIEALIRHSQNNDTRPMRFYRPLMEIR